MNIVRAEDTHIPEMIDVWEEFAVFHEDMDPHYPMVDDVRSGYEQYVRGLMKDDDNLVLVALESCKVVGLSIAQIKKFFRIRLSSRYVFVEIPSFDFPFPEELLNWKYRWIVSWFNSLNWVIPSMFRNSRMLLTTAFSRFIELSSFLTLSDFGMGNCLSRK